MREVKAIVRPQRLDQVMAALREIPGLPGVTLSPVHAYGGARPPDNPRASDGVQADFAKLEIIVPDTLLDATVSAIGRAAHTGRAVTDSGWSFQWNGSCEFATWAPLRDQHRRNRDPRHRAGKIGA